MQKCCNFDVYMKHLIPAVMARENWCSVWPQYNSYWVPKWINHIRRNTTPSEKLARNRKTNVLAVTRHSPRILPWIPTVGLLSAWNVPWAVGFVLTLCSSPGIVGTLSAFSNCSWWWIFSSTWTSPTQHTRDNIRADMEVVLSCLPFLGDCWSFWDISLVWFTSISTY